MTGKNRELEEIRTTIANAKVEIRELMVMAAIASKHLNDTNGQNEAKQLGQSVIARLSSLSQWLERQQDVYDLADNRGLNKALRQTLIERRDAINKFLEML